MRDFNCPMAVKIGIFKILILRLEESYVIGGNKGKWACLLIQRTASPMVCQGKYIVFGHSPNPLHAMGEVVRWIERSVFTWEKGKI